MPAFRGARQGSALAAGAAALAAALLAWGTGGSALAAETAPPSVPEPTGQTVTITIVEAGGKLKFVGPPTVAEGDELEIVNTTNPLKVGPFTFSLVRPGYLPKTRHAQAECFTPGHICWAVAEWQGVHGEGVPTINPAEAGLPGWDTLGAPGAPGDSWFTGLKPGTHFAQEVTARAPRRLWFMDAIHPWVRGTIKVVAP
ncbi:MAG: hypothetical protein JSS97_09660 [Actinobacteria bacterium]|nr:hypothetical protein [Actinomycetota bacterium]